MRRTSRIATAALAVVAALVTTTAVWTADAASGERRQRAEGDLQQRLGLTDDQVQALRAVRTRDAEARTQHWQSLRTAQAELRRLIVGGADEATIAAKQTEVSQLMAQSLQMRVDRLKEIVPILTPEQREQFVQMMEERKHGRGRHGPGGGPHRGQS
jgi:Spy/CpxP family protein refolding chaperone